jgi:hypothetical protein
MDAELRRLIREHYPFSIAHAHKLKCLIQTAEATV